MKAHAGAAGLEFPCRLVVDLKSSAECAFGSCRIFIPGRECMNILQNLASPTNFQTELK